MNELRRSSGKLSGIRRLFAYTYLYAWRPKCVLNNSRAKCIFARHHHIVISRLSIEFILRHFSTRSDDVGSTWHALWSIDLKVTNAMRGLCKRSKDEMDYQKLKILYRRHKCIILETIIVRVWPVTSALRLYVSLMIIGVVIWNGRAIAVCDTLKFERELRRLV